MAKFDVIDMSGKKVSTIELSDAIFGIKPNELVMHTAVVNFLANKRQGTQSTKTRSEVSGGGIKPWRQKGTGRARQGSIRSPQWRHGGVALGPKPRDYSYRLNKKVKRLAMFSSLSAKAASGDLIVVEKYDVPEFKTKTVVTMLDAIGATGKSLLVAPTVDAKVIKSANNIQGVKTAIATALNVYDIINARKFVISVDAVKMLEEVFA